MKKSKIFKSKTDVYKRFKYGSIFLFNEKPVLQLSIKIKDYPEPFIYEALKIWKDKIKQLNINIISLEKDYTISPAELAIVVIAQSEKNENRAVNDYEKAYQIFWESLLDSGLSKPDLVVEYVKNLKEIETMSSSVSIQQNEKKEEKTKYKLSDIAKPWKSSKN